MSFSCLVNLQAVDNGGVLQQDFVVGGGGISAVDVSSLIGSGGVLDSFANGDIEEFNFDAAALDAIPDNATITNVRFNLTFAGLGTVSFRFNSITDTLQTVTQGSPAFIDYPTSTPFGGLGTWFRSGFQSIDTFGYERVTGGVTAAAFFIEISFTVPDPVTPSIVNPAGGTTVTFQTSSGNFLDANYEFSWQDFPTDTGPITVVDGHTGTDVSPVRTAGPIAVSIADPQGNSLGTRPYHNPSFSGVMVAGITGFEWFTNSTTGTTSSTLPQGNVTMGGNYSSVLSIDVSGIYTLVEGKLNDTLYVRAGSTTTQDVQIPNPFVELGYIGDE